MLDKSFEQLAEIAYKEMNINPSVFIKKGKTVDIFSLLKIKPTYNEENKRILTPYEILGVPPQFNEAGKEIPIVFAIKNTIFKVAKPKQDNFNFVYKGEKVASEESIVDTLKFNYKKAIFLGNDSEAEMYFKLLDEASGGKASELLADFFNYTKFYKKMKKQLLMDIFAHFFLLYINKKAMVKNGITKKGKLFKAYKLKMQTMDSEVYEIESDMSSDLAAQNPELSVIQSIKITKPVYEEAYEEPRVVEFLIDPTVEKEPSKTENQEMEVFAKTEVQPEKKGLFGNIISRINKKRANKKMRLRAHHLFNPQPDSIYTAEEEAYILGVEEKVKQQEEKQQEIEIEAKSKEDYKALT